MNKQNQTTGEKMFSVMEKALPWIVPIFVIIIVILFTAFGFFAKQSTDLDKIFLYDRLHPFTVFDLVGTIGFYGGCFFLSGLWKFIFGDLDEKEGKKWMIISGIALVAGITLIWNL